MSGSGAARALKEGEPIGTLRALLGGIAALEARDSRRGRGPKTDERCADAAPQGGRAEYGGLPDDEGQDGRHVTPRVPDVEPIPDGGVLLEDLGGHQEFQDAVPPALQDPQRMAVLKAWVDANGLSGPNHSWKPAHEPRRLEANRWLRVRSPSEFDDQGSSS